MKQSELAITEVRVFPLGNSFSDLRAHAKIVLNESLVLSGLKIIKGQFGHFLAFPNQSPGSPYKFYDTISMRFRKRMQNDVLQEYAKALAAAIPAST